MPLLRLLPACVLLLCAAPAFAWSELGHRMVGELAERHLTPRARAEVRTLLAGESEPTLAGVASWADRLRNSDPDRFKRTGPWHYVNIRDRGCHYAPARDCPNGDCVVAAINAQARILADRSRPRDERRDALKFLVHFVGDVHQPMHAGSRPDKGGNEYQISLRTDLQPEPYARLAYVNGVQGTNLHAVWDYYVLGTRGPGYRAYADLLDAAPWPAAEAAAPRDLAAAAWAMESCRLIDARGLYPQGHRMDHAYLDAMRPLAEQRVRQAAYRLATVLDATLGTTAPL